MRAMLLTLLLVTGAQPPSVDAQQQVTTATEDCQCSNCDQSDCGAGRSRRGAFRGCLGCCGPMPQTCYAPRFGCYPGNNRHVHRYPAFHGYYYRQPYNYRHLFDYPWHATPHEPQGFFSYEVTRPSTQQQEALTPYPEPENTIPEPLPLAPDSP